MFTGLFPTAITSADNSPLFDRSWGSVSLDPIQNKVEALLSFCYPDRSMLAPQSSDAHGYENLKEILTADNLKHFLDQYKHWNIHWPMIHLPTFNPMDSNDGLVMTMACIGAVYSNRFPDEKVRWMMDLVRIAVYRSSEVYRLVSSRSNEFVDPRRSSSYIDEMQTLVLLHSLFVWNGSPQQRQQGRNDFWVLASIARRLNLLRPLPMGHPNFSAFHQPGPLDGSEINSWTWRAWVEQERRVRLMYLVFLIDASLAIFFNAQPQFDIYEMKLPLPADDAVWEARTENDCACALGLRGATAQESNSTGSKRPKQVGMCEALHHLHHSGEYPQRATNVFSKFILIHALLVQICNIQRQALGLPSPSLNGSSSSGTSTPQSHNEWPSAEGTISAGSSGRASPTDGMNPTSSQAQHTLRLTMSALELWKRRWDEDIAFQYPPHQRRIGFCRDAIHYYFLARFFLRTPRREEWTAPPDERLMQIFGLLRQIRDHVASDSAQKGLDFGSVTSIDNSYGMADLCLDMKLLFTPIATIAQ